MSWLTLLMAASITGSVQDQRPCPPACSTTISVQMQASGSSRTLQGRYFLAVFPVEGGQPNVATGGYWTGSSWQLSQVPISFRKGSLSGVQDRIRIDGGLCALAAAQGAPPGTYAIIAGFGPDVMGDRIAQLNTLSMDADVEPEKAAQLRAMIDKIGQMDGDRVSDFAAARAMRDDGTLREIGRVRCA